MRVGIVSSSEGYTFENMCLGAAHLGVHFFVVTDRACRIEQVCAAREIDGERIVDSDRQGFSRSAAEVLQSRGVDFVLLLFNRIVTADLFEALPTFNIHPSLLPAFAGLKALREAREARVRFVGATMHLVTEQADQGPIVAQVSTPVWPPAADARLSDISLVQRTYLALLAIELQAARALVVDPREGQADFVGERPYSASCNPCIVDGQMLAFIAKLEEERGTRVTR